MIEHINIEKETMKEIEEKVNHVIDFVNFLVQNETERLEKNINELKYGIYCSDEDLIEILKGNRNVKNTRNSQYKT